MKPQHAFTETSDDLSAMILSLRYRIGDVDDVNGYEYQDSDLYHYIADAADFTALQLNHGVVLSRNRMAIVSGANSVTPALRAFFVFAAQLILQCKEEYEGTKSAILIREGDATLDLRTVANVAQRTRKDLYDMLQRLTAAYLQGKFTGGRIDTFQSTTNINQL